MRPHEIFAAMPPEQSETFFARLAEESPLTFTQALAGAATAMNSRPQYLLKQPMAKRVATVRRAPLPCRSKAPGRRNPGRLLPRMSKGTPHAMARSTRP